MCPRLSPDLCSPFPCATQVSCTSRSVCAISTARCAPTFRPASPTTSTGHPWHGSCRTGSWRAMPGRLSASSTRLWAHLSECLGLLDAARAGWRGVWWLPLPHSSGSEIYELSLCSERQQLNVNQSWANVVPGRAGAWPNTVLQDTSRVAGNSLLPLEVHPSDQSPLPSKNRLLICLSGWFQPQAAKAVILSPGRDFGPGVSSPLISCLTHE